jgi:hypothetical protein
MTACRIRAGRSVLCVAGLLLLACGTSWSAELRIAAAAGEHSHPFMLWTTEEAARLRKLIETEAWAKEAYAKETWGLLRYGIVGDKAAGEVEKEALLKNLAAGKVATPADAYRYDVLYGLLSPEERERVRAAFVAAVEGAMATMARQTHYTRWNWLPNLNYAWYSRLHEVAAATGDEKLIRRIFEGPNGFKWYLDEYLSDLGFYNEEFSKMFNTPQGLVHWCWAMERLGLDDIGWGYKGRQGASVRGHIGSILRIGMPAVNLENGTLFFPRLTIGDTRGSGQFGIYGLQHSLFQLSRGAARGDWFVELLQIAHAKWPNDGYGWFLAHLREPGQQAYTMPLRFGVPPIEPAKVRPPPAPSGVYPGRGLAVLRAEEGPDYWTSPGPAVGLRLATPYGHFVYDSFALTGFYAFNRPIFANHSHATNYTGVDPGYSNSARSHCIVMVDRQEPDTLLKHAETRQHFGSRVKFVAARARGVYPDVDQTRALMLTREYLLDVSHLVSDRVRDYTWLIHTFGHACPDRPDEWTDSSDLLAWFPDVGFERSSATDQAWSVTAVQVTGGANPQFSTLGERWFQRRVGVRTTVLGEAGTRAYTAWGPVVADTSGQWRGRGRFIFGEEEPAAVVIAANRKAPRTTFIAVHEPFEGTPRIRAIRLVARQEDCFVLAVEAENFTDYLMLRLGDRAIEPVTMGDGGERFTFTDHGYARVSAGKPEVEGDVRLDAAQLPQKASAPPRAPGPIAARWRPPTGLGLPAGGKRTVTLKLRNSGPTPITSDLAIAVAKGLFANPATVALRDFAPGAEMDVAVTVDGAKAPANEFMELTVRAAVPGPQVERAALCVANGVASTRHQLGSDFYQIVYSPRYIAKVWFMESGAALELLDPQGYRRNDATTLSYPSLMQTTTDSQGRARTEAKAIPKFPYFIPIVIKDPQGGPNQLYDAGRHAHGRTSALEQWFTEDWIIVRHREAKADETISFVWLPRAGLNGLESIYIGRDAELAAQKKPGKVIVVDENGASSESSGDPKKGRAAWPRTGGGVSALFVRPAGFDYGYAMFYPTGSRLQGQQVLQPGDKPMGFAFCTEAEFGPLVKKWRENTPTGQVDPKDAARYHGAFGPQPVP